MENLTLPINNNDFPSIIRNVAENGPLTFRIDVAREIIAASEGTVTWTYAGAEWATLVTVEPGVRFPAL